MNGTNPIPELVILSSIWIYYSVQMNDTPLVMRSST